MLLRPDIGESRITATLQNDFGGVSGGVTGAPGLRVLLDSVSRRDCLRVVTSMTHTPARVGGVLRRGAELTELRLRLCYEHTPSEDEARPVLAAVQSAAHDLIQAGDRAGLRLDGLKFCSYAVGGFFRAHRDRSSDSSDPIEVRARTISFVCVLNDNNPEDGLPTFDGGTLVIYFPQADGSVKPVNLLPPAGAVISFPADLMHEVRPIRSGTRFTAVGWLYDPQMPLKKGTGNDGPAW